MKHRQAQWLLTKVLAQRNREVERNTLRPTIRVGLSGSPGAGKSTLIESLGLRLVEQGLRVAVLVSKMLLTYIYKLVLSRMWLIEHISEQNIFSGTYF